MSELTAPQNQIPNEPSLADLLDLKKKETLLGLNCHHLATIQSFDADRQVATATINYKKTFIQLNPATGVYGPVQKDYPILADCPVIVLGGGAGALTFPIQPGDECIALFNDRDINNWFNGSSNSQVASPRLHSFADAIILVGVRSLANTLDNYDSLRAVLRNGTTLVGVGPTLIKIANQTTTLNTLLQSLLTDITALNTALITLTTAMSSATPATVVAQIAVPSGVATTAITAVSTSIAALATQIAGLLE